MDASTGKQRLRQAVSRPRRVWANVSADTHWGRDVLSGIVSRARFAGWQVLPYTVEDPAAAGGRLAAVGLGPGRATAGTPRPDGIIAQVGSRELAETLEAARVPTVNVSNLILDGPTFPRVNIDLEACAALAADHLAGLGIRSFLYVGPKGYRCGELQHAAFAARLGRHPADIPAVWYSYELDANPTAFQRMVVELPKPLGVFVRYMGLTQAVARTIMTAGIHVPESVAILSGDDDPLLAEMSTPSVSAIDVGTDRVGARAAELLDDLMAGRPAPKEPILLPPLGIISRGSTDILPTDNDLIVGAIRFIRANLARPIKVDDLARETRLSRRMLFQRFHDELGRSPVQEIRRIRLAHAQSLLATADLSIDQVARLSGFKDARYMARIFMAEFGKPPTAFRRPRA